MGPTQARSIFTYGSPSGDPNYFPEADFDSNGFVNSDDLAAFAQSFGTN